MFRLHVHRITCSNAFSNDRVMLDISSDGQRPRRFDLGSLTLETPTKALSCINHLTASPITLTLTHGPLIYQQIDVKTLFDFLTAPASSLPTKRSLTFARRAKAPVYTIDVSLALATHCYSLNLLSVTALKPLSPPGSSDRVTVDIEVGPSPHLVSPPLINTMHLGPFSRGSTSLQHTNHNASVTTLVNWTIEFTVSTLLGQERTLGSVQLVPIDDVDVNWEPSDSTDYQTILATGAEDETLQSRQARITPPKVEGAGGLLYVSSTPEDEPELLLEGPTTTLTRQVTFASGDGAAVYSVVFALTKSLHAALNNPALVPPSPWRSVPGQSHTDSTLGAAAVAAESSPSPTSLPEGPIGSAHFSVPTKGNQVEVLIDGLATFHRYYQALMRAQHSICITAWELNLSFGLALRGDAPPLFETSSHHGWFTLQDVLLDRAMSGVQVRVLVWRHPWLSQISRYLYLGDASIEVEVARFKLAAAAHGVTVVVERAVDTTPGQESPYAKPLGPMEDADIVIVIVGNPRGIVSTHHEKLVLIDGECPGNTVAFMGGFDMARCRFDQPLHLYPRRGGSVLDLNHGAEEDALRRLRSHLSSSSPTDASTADQMALDDTLIQPALHRIRFLWHDHAIMLRGPATRQLKLHWAQRWVNAFGMDTLSTRLLRFDYTIQQDCTSHPKDVRFSGAQPMPEPTSEPVRTPMSGHFDEPAEKMSPEDVGNPVNAAPPDPSQLFPDVELKVARTWANVFDGQFMLRDFTSTIASAKHYVYVEHQYCFQNYSLTRELIAALEANPKLRVIIVCPVTTDLPNGIVGELVDAAQDHINEDLELIKNTAPNRVGVYGLVSQDPLTRKLKPIYVHAKLMIVDDEVMLIGSANMDNISFFRSSELVAVIKDKRVAQTTRNRLFQEHLGTWYKRTMEEDFVEGFNAFHSIASQNLDTLRDKRTIVGRPVFLAPNDYYKFIREQVEGTSSLYKWMYRLGWVESPLSGMAQRTVHQSAQDQKAASDHPLVAPPGAEGQLHGQGLVRSAANVVTSWSQGAIGRVSQEMAGVLAWMNQWVKGQGTQTIRPRM